MSTTKLTKSKKARLTKPQLDPTTATPAPALAPLSGLGTSVEQLTVVEATIDVGLGNALFIRGEGDGLSWNKGQALSCRDAATWVWSTTKAQDKILFKLLLNDTIWAQGEDLSVQAGDTVKVTPAF